MIYYDGKFIFSDEVREFFGVEILEIVDAIFRDWIFETDESGREFLRVDCGFTMDELERLIVAISTNALPFRVEVSADCYFVGEKTERGRVDVLQLDIKKIEQ